MNDVIESQTVREEGSTAYGLMSAAEYSIAPGLAERTELVKGKIVDMTPPSGRHGQICNRVAYLITHHADQHQSGHVMTNDAAIQTAPDTVRGADVAYLSFEKQPKGPLPDDFNFPIPEVVFEVLSKTDRWSNVFAKIGEYLIAGVQVVIVLEPELSSVRCFRDDGSDVHLNRSDMLTIPEIKPAFECRVGDFF